MSIPKGTLPKNFSLFQSRAREVNTGGHHSAAHKSKISAALKGRKLSFETRRRMSEARKGKPLLHAQGRKNYGYIDGRTLAPGYKQAYTQFNNRRQKLKRKGVPGHFTHEQFEALKAVVKYMCLCCKQHEPYIKLTADHIIPISKGGTNDISNIQPLCHSCNSRKSTKAYAIIGDFTPFHELI